MNYIKVVGIVVIAIILGTFCYSYLTEIQHDRDIERLQNESDKLEREIKQLEKIEKYLD